MGSSFKKSKAIAILILLVLLIFFISLFHISSNLHTEGSDSILFSKHSTEGGVSSALRGSGIVLPREDSDAHEHEGVVEEFIPRSENELKETDKSNDKGGDAFDNITLINSNREGEKGAKKDSLMSSIVSKPVAFKSKNEGASDTGSVISTAKNLTSAPIEKDRASEESLHIPSIVGLHSDSYRSKPVESLHSPAHSELVVLENVPKPRPLDVKIINDGYIGDRVEDMFYSLLPTSLNYGEEQHCVSVKPISSIVSSDENGEHSGDIRMDGIKSNRVGLDVVKLVRASLDEGQSFNESYNVGSASPLLDPLRGLADIISSQLQQSEPESHLFIELSSYTISSTTIAHSIASAHAAVTSLLVHSSVSGDKSFGESDDPSAIQVEGLEDIADHVVCSTSAEGSNVEHDMSVVVRPDPLNLYILQDNNALLRDAGEIESSGKGSRRSSSSSNRVGFSGYGNSLERNCVQYIDDLEDLVGGLLPFEFEALLQKVLCRCSVTYLPLNFPLGASNYFDYWESMGELIEHVNLKLSVKASERACVVSYNKSSHINQVLHRAKLYEYAAIERTSPKVISDSVSVGQLIAASPITSHYHKIIAMVALHPSSTDIPLAFLLKSQNDFEAAVSIASSRMYGDGSDHEYNSRVRHQHQQYSTYSQKRNAVVAGIENLTFPILEVAASWLDSFKIKGSLVEWKSMSSDRWAELLSDNGSSQLSLSGRKLLSSRNSKLLTSASRSHDTGSSTRSSFSSSIYKTSSATEELVDLSDVHTSRRKAQKALLDRTPSLVHLDSDAVPSGGSERNNQFISENSNPNKNYWLEWPSFESIDAYMEQKGSFQYTFPDPTGMSSDIRAQQQLLQAKESNSYTRWMNIFRKTYHFDGFGQDSTHEDSIFPMNELRHAKLVYIAGRHASMLSIKLSKMLHAQQKDEFVSHAAADVPGLGMVVSLLHDPSSIQPHETLLEVMNIHNNIVCSSVLQMGQLAALATSPERASIAVYQVDVTLRIFTIAWLTASSVVPLPANAGSKPTDGHASMDGEICVYMHSLLQKMFGILIASADVTYMEMPTVERLMSVLSAVETVSTLSPQVSRTSTNRNMVRLLLSMQCGKGYLEDNKDASASTLDASFNLHVLEKSIQRLGYRFQSNDAVKLNYRVTELRHDANEESLSIYRIANNDNSGTLHGVPPKHSGEGVSLYSLLHMGIVNSHKKKIFKMLMDFPTWSGADQLADAMPWDLFVNIASTSVKVKSAASNIEKAANQYSASGGKSTPSDITSDSYTLESSLRMHLVGHSKVVGETSPGVILDKGNRGASKSSLKTEQLEANLVYSMIMNEFNAHSGELASGKFSCVEHASGNGFLSMQIANRFPNATMFSLENDPVKVNRHEFMVNRLGIQNNYIARTSPSGRSKILYNLYDSPELFRFQIVNDGLYTHGETALLPPDVEVGVTLSIALTSFIKVPSSKQVSWAMEIMHKTGYIAGPGHHNSHANSLLRNLYQKVTMLPIRQIEKETSGTPHDSGYTLKSHPTKEYDDFESYWLLGSARLPQSSVHSDKDSSVAWLGASNTKVSITPMFLNGQRVPWVRSDIINMTRHVHHHYDYSKDGHARTYTMRIAVNDTITGDVNAMLAKDGLKEDASHMVGIQNDQGILLYPSWDALESPHKEYRTVYPVLKEILDDVSEGEKQKIEKENAEARASYERTKSDASLPILLPSGHHANQHQITSVHLYRDRDGFPIPYVSVYGITLITALRLGIIEKQLNNLYNSFLKLPLFEDMAPWNIVLMGGTVDYIDYDTKDMFYDLDIPKAYQIMTVLMNYKRTVEDFKRCGTKGNTVYGLPYVSDCVGSTVGHSGVSKSMPKSCPDLKLPVPCGDGNCHSDYISCLRSFADIDAEYALTLKAIASSGNDGKSKKQIIADSIKGGIAAFNDKGLY